MLGKDSAGAGAHPTGSDYVRIVREVIVPVEEIVEKII